MTLDVNDLRAVFDEASTGPHDNPRRLAELDRRIRRDARRRYTIAAVSAAAVLVALVVVPLAVQDPAGSPVLSPSSEADRKPARQDRGPRLDLRKGPEPVIGTPPVIQSEAEFPLPLDAYRPTDDYGLKVTWAVNQKARDCLRRYGLDMPKAEGAVPAVRVPGLALVRAWGVADPARAATYGYGFAPVPGDDGSSLDPPESQPYRDMNKTEFSVYSGTATAHNGLPVPEGGCLQEAHRILGYTGAFYGDDVQMLLQQALKYTLRDSRVKAVTLQWHDCMRRAGFSYASPQQASADPAWQHKTTAREIATAQADVTCKQQTNLLGIGLTVQAAYEQQLIDRNAAALAPLRTRLTELEKNVAKVVDDHGP